MKVELSSGQVKTVLYLIDMELMSDIKGLEAWKRSMDPKREMYIEGMKNSIDNLIELKHQFQ